MKGVFRWDMHRRECPKSEERNHERTPSNSEESPQKANRNPDDKKWENMKK